MITAKTQHTVSLIHLLFNSAVISENAPAWKTISDLQDLSNLNDL
jgi:hypothetical protein